MKMDIKELAFHLPANPFGSCIQTTDELTAQLKQLERRAGTTSDKFNKTFVSLYSAIHNRQDLIENLDKPIKVRALAIVLQTIEKPIIRFTKAVFEKIRQLRPNHSTLFIQNVYQYYLTWYDQLEDRTDIAEWLISVMKQKGLLEPYHHGILSDDGPQWIAGQCVQHTREFNNQLRQLDLEKYFSGRFVTMAKQAYFLEQLKVIPINEPHDLLVELQGKATFESQFDEQFLLGHKALQVLINRAPETGIADSWLNTILAIAGDPRVPVTHPKYQKWWAHIDNCLKQKVHAWLSRLDLRLFLEALDNFAKQHNNEELNRMFPARKSFLEGLLNKDFITGTRLYLTASAERYLKKNYKSEHLPEFSRVSDANRSIVHVQLIDGKHLIEGTHECKLWIYPKLDDSAVVFRYKVKRVSYRDLTLGLSEKMAIKGTPHIESITHRGHNYLWQHQAISTLNKIGVNIHPRDVLSERDYLKYKRSYGVSYGV
ncbi:MAG: transcriptional regulator [Methylococcales bacterium]|jgi:hypothetical protein|nr:transcriptional regulator [Methylococcales bacterium]